MPVGTVELISQAEYARRRGCTEGAVRRAVRDGRIALFDGKVDPVAADAQWARNTRPRAGSEPGAGAAGPGLGAEAGGGASAGAPEREDEDGSGGYWVSKARREAAEADLAEMKLAEQRRSLISVKAVSDQLALDYATTREGLLQLPSRMGSTLAAETDPAAVERLLRTEIHQALTRLAGAADAVLRADESAAR